MDEEIKKRLAADPDGLITYEFIANNIDSIDPVLPELVDNMISVDASSDNNFRRIYKRIYPTGI